jgi:solute:Na+ symporter, SSS family
VPDGRRRQQSSSADDGAKNFPYVVLESDWWSGSSYRDGCGGNPTAYRATLFAKNLCRPILAPGMTDRQVGPLAKIMVLVLTVTALLLAIRSSATLVSLLLPGYDGVAQLFPGVVLGLFSRRVTTTCGLFAGLVTGISVATFLMLTGRDPYMGLNAAYV